MSILGCGYSAQNTREEIVSHIFPRSYPSGRIKPHLLCRLGGTYVATPQGGLNLLCRLGGTYVGIRKYHDINE